jgi:hypothetical protein
MKDEQFQSIKDMFWSQIPEDVSLAVQIIEDNRADLSQLQKEIINHLSHHVLMANYINLQGKVFKIGASGASGTPDVSLIYKDIAIYTALNQMLSRYTSEKAWE